MDNLVTHYRTGKHVRPHGMDEQKARANYARFLRFATPVLPPQCTLIDIGCGVGWSCRLLQEAGHRVIGIDLGNEVDDSFDYVCGSATELPFRDGVLDAAVSHQMIEHVGDPERALDEMARVVRPGGVIIIVSPNLLSCLGSLRAFWYARKSLRRHPGMPRHPGGNTLPEVFVSFFTIHFRLLKKILSRDASFDMREPDLDTPAHADNDASYWSNPIDLLRYFGARGYTIIAKGASGRPPLSWLITSGMYLAFRKPGEDCGSSVFANASSECSEQSNRANTSS